VQQLQLAIDGLSEALSGTPRFERSWRHIVRQRLQTLADALAEERTVAPDAWLSPRAGHLHRERDKLLARIRVIGVLTSENADIETLRQTLNRLVQDVEHHQQRINDLVYDAVGMDFGGSE
jgi:hypothetical protein